MIDFRFDNNYPEIDSLGIFSKRHEASFVFHGEAEKFLSKKILHIFPQSSVKSEVIATTYFEQSLSYESQKTCIARFRQRSLGDKLNVFPLRRYWLLSGPGAFEVKIRKVNTREDVIKMGTFLPERRGRNIYSLLHLAQLKNSDSALVKFITRANSEQIKAVKRDNSQYLCLITPRTLLAIKDSLRPYATRVNLRKTFEITRPQKVRITLETHPLFYIYPIDYQARKYNHTHHKYKGILTESPNRCKIEIKSLSKSLVNELTDDFGRLIKNFGVPYNKYTQEPYYKMVLTVSKQAGTLVDEFQNHEIEAKANFKTRHNLLQLINKIRTKIIERKGNPYRLFPTDSGIKVRGEDELNRTVIGWRDSKNRWHETVTNIRLSKNGVKEHGFFSVLKWKADSRSSKSFVLDRQERKEFLRQPISDKELLRLADRVSKAKNQVAGVMKKWKYRLHVQDRNGRVFILSLDECMVPGFKSVLQQLEIEYAHTVIIKHKKSSLITIQKSCKRCLDYFIDLLSGFGVDLEKTDLRKIDYLGSLLEKDSS